jgi:hypothetical protein
MDRIVLDSPDPAEVFTREQLRAALAAVRARSGMSLSDIVSRSGQLKRANAGLVFGAGGHKPVELRRLAAAR